MIVKQNDDGTTEITTTVYQAKNGGIYINWGKKSYPLEKERAEILAWDIQDFDNEKYVEFYNF